MTASKKNLGIMAGLDEYVRRNAGATKKEGGVVPGYGPVGTIAGPGTGRSDSVPAKVGNTEFKVSNREGIAVLPEKTMLSPGAVEAVKYIIEKTNGLPPKLAIASGVGFSNGLVSALDAATKAAQPATPPSAQLPSTGIASNPPLAGLQSATRPMQPGETGVEMIDGIRHSTVPAVSAGKTVSAVTNAAGETANRLTGGVFDFEGRAQEARDRQRAELEVKPAAPATASSTTTGRADGPKLVSGIYGIMAGVPGFTEAKGVADASPLERSNRAFSMSQEIDKATGTGPGATLDASLKPNAPQRLDFGIMGKRFDAYQKDPALLDQRNAREEMLGSGLRMERGPNGITITGNGIAGNATIGDGASSINMQEGNERLARANAIRQSMIDSQASRGGVSVIGGSDQGPGDLLKTVLTPHAGSPNGQFTANQLNAARGIMADAQFANMKGAEIAQRGQEAASQEAIENRRLGMGIAAMEGQQLDNQQKAMVFDLQKRAAAGDAKAAESLKLFQLKRENEPSVRDRYLPIESEQSLPTGERTKTTTYYDTATGKTVGGKHAT